MVRQNQIIINGTDYPYTYNEETFSTENDVLNYFLNKSHNPNSTNYNNINNSNIYIKNIKINGIVETYDINRINGINREGTLCVILKESNSLIVNIYDLFDNFNGTSYQDNGVAQSNIPYRIIMNNTFDPSLESSHRLVLIKDSDNVYYASPLLIGNNSSFLYSIDIPEFEFNGNLFTPADNGLYESNEKIDKIKNFIISYKPYLYINPHTDSQISISFDEQSGFSNINIVGAGSYIINSDQVLDNEDASKLKFSIIGTEESPNTLLFEIR